MWQNKMFIGIKTLNIRLDTDKCVIWRKTSGTSLTL